MESRHQEYAAGDVSRYPAAYDVLRFSGAVYLIWLGIQRLMPSKQTPRTEDQGPRTDFLVLAFINDCTYALLASRLYPLIRDRGRMKTARYAGAALYVALGVAAAVLRRR